MEEGGKYSERNEGQMTSVNVEIVKTRRECCYENKSQKLNNLKIVI